MAHVAKKEDLGCPLVDKLCVRLKGVSPISSLLWGGGVHNLPAVSNINTEIGKWLIAALVIAF